MVIAIIIGDVLVLAVVSVLLHCDCGKFRNAKGSQILEGEKAVYSSSPYPHTTTQPGFERGRMVFFEGAKRFELEDLLRASAEMLGKGGFGTAYKAVLDDGNVVAVKRLKEASIGGRIEFEQQMEVLGRLRHQNVVGLKSYYFARDEKLLVYDYMPNGSLFWLLHEDSPPICTVIKSSIGPMDKANLRRRKTRRKPTTLRKKALLGRREHRKSGTGGNPSRLDNKAADCCGSSLRTRLHSQLVPVPCTHPWQYKVHKHPTRQGRKRACLRLWTLCVRASDSLPLEIQQLSCPGSIGPTKDHPEIRCLLFWGPIAGAAHREVPLFGG
ncbi:hypothetical protein TEA_006981 [Camellia sinensis var. sinensis]|uniref:Protein kinase domain-containing protein n=1 Tax=Camellia sinensis var. sinensis TaxID=542762 RepID=A0A4S4EA13_CAMSN|nr:hypothetical protein TEA_006981 [Camellia sinensis var. sinensis]